MSLRRGQGVVGRDGDEIEALRTDRYLEMLMGWHESAAVEAARPTDVGRADDVDPAVRLAASRLQRDLQRVHPSFRFEDRLARRLSEIASAVQLPLAAGGEARSAGILPFPFRPDDDPAAARLDAEVTSPGVPRPVLIGGAVASAALSIAGAAFVAWRLGRGGDPMTKAVRAAHQLRLVVPGALVGPDGIIGPGSLD